MRPSIGRAIAGGFVGTAAMTVMLYVVAPMVGIKMDIAASLAQMMGTQWSVGLLAHFMNGVIVFPLIYAFVVFRLAKGGPTAKGATWSVILWLAAQTMVMPMMGAGFFSAHLGIMAVMGSLLNHAIYGALLGWIAGSQEVVVSHRAIVQA